MIIKLNEKESEAIIEKYIRAMMNLPPDVNVKVSSESYAGLSANVQIDGATEKPEEE